MEKSSGVMDDRVAAAGATIVREGHSDMTLDIWVKTWRLGRRQLSAEGAENAAWAPACIAMMPVPAMPGAKRKQTDRQT